MSGVSSVSPGRTPVKEGRRGRQRGAAKTTIRDVAALAGVSIASVSYVLNDRHDQVSAATRERIEKAVRSLGYHPSAAARHMRGQGLRSIGVIGRSGLNPAQSALLRGAERAAAARGYTLVLGYVEHETDAAEYVEPLLAGRVDGVLIPFGYADLADVAAYLGSRSVPFVACTPVAQNAVPPARGLVGLDNAAGIRQAMQHLAGLGHRRIAFATHANAGSHAAQRLDAFRREVAALGLDAAECPIEVVEVTAGGSSVPLEAGRQAAQRLARWGVRPTAVMTSLDLVALGVLQGAWQAGWRVPEELSVVGFDDTPFAAASIPPLTTLRVAWDEIGQVMANELLGALSGAAVGVHVSTPELVVRESTAGA